MADTPIDGLLVRMNKVVSDKRGILCELAPSGSNDEFLKGGIGNIHSSIAVGRNSIRAGHYHLKNEECFFTLSGVALWVFHDWRSDSPTRGKSYAFVAGLESYDVPSGIENYSLSNGAFPEVKVPAGVYHAFSALTDTAVVVVSIASMAYDKNDYVYPELSQMAELLKILRKFRVVS